MRRPTAPPAPAAYRGGQGCEVDTVKHWRALIVLGTAPFVMVLDTSVITCPSVRRPTPSPRTWTTIRSCPHRPVRQVGIALQAGLAFVSTDQARSAAERAGLPSSQVDAVANYSHTCAQAERPERDDPGHRRHGARRFPGHTAAADRPGKPSAAAGRRCSGRSDGIER